MSDRGWPFPPLLGDGAMGTLLLGPRLVTDYVPAASLTLTEPDRVLAAHKAYRDAGAGVLQTNTFGANAVVLAGTPWEDRTRIIVESAVMLAREAASGALVAGSVGPAGQEPGWVEFNRAEAVAAYDQTIGALLEAGVDFLLLETMFDLEEAALAVERARALAAGTPVACTVSVGPDLHLVSGETAQDAAARLASAGADAIGLNCGVGPASVLAAALAMRRVTSVPLILQPSAGMPSGTEQLSWPLTPEGFAAFVTEARSLGAVLIGGCCGTTPAHIAAAARR